MWRTVSMALVLVGVVELGCGGGGGGGDGGDQDPLESLPYNGVRSQATLTAATAEELMLSAYYGAGRGRVTLRSSSTVAAPSQPLVARLQRLQDAVRRGAGAAVRPGPSERVAARATPKRYRGSEPGACGGSVVFDLEVDEGSGDFAGSATFEGYDTCDEAISGSVEAMGRLSLETLDFLTFSMSFEFLQTIGTDGYRTTSSGRVSIEVSGATASSTYDVRMRDEGTGKVYWLDGFQMMASTTFDQAAGQWCTAETQSAGRYYDPDHGYLSVSTVTPVKACENETRRLAGSLEAQGAGGTRGWLHFLSPVLYRVEADTDGNGVPDFDTGRLHYPGANTLPVAAIAGPPGGHVLAAASMDGTGSSDPDWDTLTYAWTLIDRPAGSTAVLEGAATAAASFTPDVDGEYRVRLVVYDGTQESLPALFSFVAVNDAPEARLAAGEALLPGEEALFDAGASRDPEGSALSYRIDFGDGTAPVEQTSPLFRHTYWASGTHRVTLTVLDHLGAATGVATDQTCGLRVGPPTNVSPPSSGGWIVHAASAEGGRLHAVWEAGSGEVRAAHSDDEGRTFSAPALVNAGHPAGLSDHTHLGLSAGGRVSVVWFGTSGILFALSTDGGASFGEPVDLTGPVPGGGPRIAAQGTPRVTVVWTDTLAAGGPRLLSRTSADNGGTFADPVVVDSFQASGRSPVSADTVFGPDEELYVVWVRVGPSDENEVAFSSSRDGSATFAAPRVLSEPDEVSMRPRLAADQTGTIHLLRWIDWGSLEPRLAYQRSTDAGASFDRARILSLLSPGGESCADMAAAADGTVFITWSERRSGQPKAWLAVSRDRGATFGAPLALYRGGRSIQCPVLVALDRASVGLAWSAAPAPDEPRNIFFTKVEVWE